MIAMDKEAYDVVLLHGRTDDGEGLRALRSRPGRLEAAEIRPTREGEHIGDAELVTLHPREVPILCDVEVQYDPRSPDPGPVRAGPPRVASDAYRAGWDLVFGSNRLTCN